ncbi:hypothetical protein U0070_023925, partial [Myodes glareolus]
ACGVHSAALVSRCPSAAPSWSGLGKAPGSTPGEPSAPGTVLSGSESLKSQCRGERPLQGHCVEKLEHRPVPKLELVAAMTTEPGGLPGRTPKLERSAVTWLWEPGGGRLGTGLAVVNSNLPLSPRRGGKRAAEAGLGFHGWAPRPRRARGKVFSNIRGLPECGPK